MTRSIRAPRRDKSEPSGWKSMPDEQPRECYRCGQPIRISRESCGFRTMPPLLSWHTGCRGGLGV